MKFSEIYHRIVAQDKNSCVKEVIFELKSELNYMVKYSNEHL